MRQTCTSPSAWGDVARAAPPRLPARLAGRDDSLRGDDHLPSAANDRALAELQGERRVRPQGRCIEGLHVSGNLRILLDLTLSHSVFLEVFLRNAELPFLRVNLYILLHHLHVSLLASARSERNC